MTSFIQGSAYFAIDINTETDIATIDITLIHMTIMDTTTPYMNIMDIAIL